MRFGHYFATLFPYPKPLMKTLSLTSSECDSLYPGPGLNFYANICRRFMKSPGEMETFERSLPALGQGYTSSFGISAKLSRTFMFTGTFSFTFI